MKPLSQNPARLTILFFALLLAGCAPVVTPAPTPVPQETLSVSLDPGAAPARIVAQSPLPGERLQLEPLIRIVFDRDMDPAATAAAWRFSGPGGRAMAGRVSWPDARTFEFRPGARLKPASSYTAVFSDALTGAELRLEFHTLDALAVGQVFPAVNAEGVDVSTNITLIFNRPVVPVRIEEEQGQLPQPLEISPGLPGHGEWVNSSVYVFQPDALLHSGTRYQLRVAAGLADTLGNSLPADYTWQFQTRAPEIAHYSLQNGAQNPRSTIANVLLDQAFIVQFAQPMEAASVAKALTLTNRETRAPFATSLQWNKDFTQLIIRPAGRYAIGAFYDLALANSAEARGGGTLKTGLAIHFSTVPLPRIEEVSPAAGSVADAFDPWVTIRFASPMSFASLKGKVRVSPQPEQEPTLYYDQYQWKLRIGGLRPATEYVVRVLPGAVDIYGNAIRSEYSFSFKTGNLAPRAQMMLPWNPLVYREKGEQEFFFDYTNLTMAKFSLYRLEYNEFTGQVQAGQTPGFSPAGKALREWRPDLQPADSNRLVRMRVPLQDEHGKPLSPGYYFIGLNASPLDYSSAFLQGAVFVVATDNITLKTTSSEALAWVVDLEQGRPVANVPVAIYGRNSVELGRASTDAKGLVSLKGLKDPYFAQLVDGSRHVAVASSDWGSGVSAYDFGLWENYYGGSASAPFAYLYTDRPLYRPGQEVFFKGIVRQNDDLHYSLPPQQTVYVTITDGDERVYAESLSLSALGSFTGTFKLGEEAALGSYNISVSTDQTSEAYASLAFRVAEYHKPEFQVAASAAPANALAGDKLAFDLDASYYSGGSVGAARVEWFLETRSYSFRPGEKYNRYSFTDWDRDSYWTPPSVGGATLAHGEGHTGPDGKLRVEQAGTGLGKLSRTVSLSANVTDVAGNLVSAQTEMVVHQTSAYAGIRARQYVGRQGEAQDFDLVALDWGATPVSGQALTVDFVQRRWFSVQQQDDQGQLRWVSSVKDVSIGPAARVTTDKDGLATVSFVPPAGGVYKAVVTLRDAKGHSQKASTYTWVSSDDYIAWRQTNDRSFSLIADKSSYAPGDTAEIMIAQPFAEDVYALVTYERGHVYKQDVLLLQGNSTVYKLPITKEMAPMAYISVVVVSGARDGRAPDFKLGLTRIDVDTSQQTLDVSVSVDQKSAGPGDEVTYTVQTRDQAGNAVSAEVSLAVVDKAVLALAPANSGAILAQFYPEQGLGVMTSVGIVLSAEDFNANYEETPPDGASSGSGGGGGKGMSDLGIITVRQDFKDTAYFSAQVMTADDGKAQVKVKLPENLTTWQVDVRAVTEDSRVGQTTGELLSTKPLHIEMQTPRFFVAGDRAVVGATVHNNSATPLKVDVSLEALGVDLQSASAQALEIPAGQQAYATWELAVKKGVERVDLTARVSGGGFTDASKPALGTLPGQGLPVYSFTIPEAVGTSGLLSAETSQTEAFQLPAALKLEDATIAVELSTSLAASMKDGLTYLQDYPYLCLEQTVSRFLPNVAAARILKLSGQPALTLQGDLDAQVGPALQRIYAKQNGDGGWSWWDGEKSSLQTSTYVVLGLVEAKAAGYDVSETVYARAIEYLKNEQGGPRENAPSWEYNRQAFLLYVLARAGETADTGSLYEQRFSLNLYGKAYLAQAIFLGDANDKRSATLMADLNANAVLSAAGAHWEEGSVDYWNWNTDLRTTAIVLDAYTRIDPANPLTANAVRWLMAHRSGGHWSSTQETAWTLLALTDWLAASREFDTHYQYAVGLNGSSLRAGTATKDNLAEPLKLQVGLKDLLAEQANYLVITRGQGTGNLYYSAYMSVSLPVESVEPLDQGMIVSRQYFGLDAPKTPITQVTRGDLVRVRLTVVVPNAVHYVVINDPLPAGLEALDASLATDTQVPQAYTRQDYDARGWGWWYFAHIEQRDEKVVLSADYLPAGTYVYTYLARASTAGTFKVLPPNAAEFYFPDVAGRGAGSTFTVK